MARAASGLSGQPSASSRASDSAPPLGPGEPHQRLGVSWGEKVLGPPRQERIEPGAKSGNGRQGGEGFQVRKFLRQHFDHPLDQEVAEADSGQPPLGVGDGIEDGRIGPRRVKRRGVLIGQGLHIARHVPDQRHLDEDQRLVRHPGWKKAKQRRSESRRFFRSCQDRISCTAS